MTEQSKFTYSSLGKALEKQTKAIGNEDEKQTKSIEEYGKQLVKSNAFPEKEKGNIMQNYCRKNGKNRKIT